MNICDVLWHLSKRGMSSRKCEHFPLGESVHTACFKGKTGWKFSLTYVYYNSLTVVVVVDNRVEVVLACVLRVLVDTLLFMGAELR